jgi:hypothetical protein
MRFSDRNIRPHGSNRSRYTTQQANMFNIHAMLKCLGDSSTPKWRIHYNRATTRQWTDAQITASTILHSQQAGWYHSSHAKNQSSNFLWYDTDRRANDVSYIFACVFVAAGTCLPSRCLVTVGGIHTDTQTTRRSRKPTFIYSKQKK